MRVLLLGLGWIVQKEARLLGSNDLMRVAPESGPPDFFEVRVASLPVPVRVEYSAIRDLRSGFDGNEEAMGLLLGSSSPHALSIKRCELLALSPATLSDPKSLQGALRQFIRARLQTPLQDAPELLGCFRTLTTGWAGMKDGDLSIAKRSFPKSDPLFLLIRTTQHRPWVAALYALDAERSTTSSEPALEFPFDEYLLRNGYLTDLVEASEPVDLPSSPNPIRLNKTQWIIAAVLSAILLGGSAALYKGFRPEGGGAGWNASGNGSLSLKVNRSGRDFELSWDRLSAVLKQASGGTLTISDGALTRSVALSAAQLREGRILYTPLFEELTFRLEVANPNLGATAESVQVLAWSGKEAADTLTIAPPDPLTNSPARIVAGDTPGPASRLPETKLPGPLPVSPRLESVKPENSRRNSGTTTPPAAAKSAPANIEIQPLTTQASPVPQTVAVIHPPSPNTAPKQEASPATAARVPEVSPPSVTSEKSPVTQPAPQSPANAPPSQAQPPPAPKQVAPAPKQVAPAPKPEAPPPVSQAVPAVSSPPPTPIASGASAASPAAVAGTPRTSGPAVLPVPVQRVPPTLPRNIPAGTTAGSPRTVSVRVMVNSSGSVQNAEVVSSTPKGAFGEAAVKAAALDAAKKWTFRPGQLNGNNVAAEYTIDFKFQ
jgi:TonB family protein